MALCCRISGRGSSSGSGDVAFRPRVETHARSRQGVRGMKQTVRLVVLERETSDIDIRFGDETQPYVHARVDVRQSVEDLIDDSVHGGVVGDVFACRTHVADGRKGAA